MGKILNYLIFPSFLFLPIGVHAMDFSVSSCDAKINNVKKISAVDLVVLSQATEGLIILDVRRDNDWKVGHIDGAVNISRDRLSAGRLQQVAKKGMPLVVYADGTHNCKNSYSAVRNAYNWGWKNIYWLSGGLAEWGMSGYPLARVQYFNWQE